MMTTTTTNQRAQRTTTRRFDIANTGTIFTLAALACITVIPIVFLVVASFARHWYFPALAPREFSTRAWEYVASSSSGATTALWMSLAIAFIVTILSVLIALPAARALALCEFKGKRILVFLLMLPVIAPPLAATMGVHHLFLRLDLTDSLAGVVLVHLIPCVPYATLMLASSFANFDTDIEAQARTLGANAFDVWRYVTLPAAAPGLAVAAAFAFLISWSQYLTTLFIGGNQVVTLPLILIGFQRAGDEATTSALSLVFLLPTLLVFIVVARFIKRDASKSI
ncbi:MAG: ABC transporter permease subunit [Pyrinomonadaceae bacterium MAG19_C2-C3]|nr:ABC transporter permease subunit [Pyrinomonadaceae bacterium MAG19_C2-C3]